MESNQNEITKHEEAPNQVPVADQLPDSRGASPSEENELGEPTV